MVKLPDNVFIVKMTTGERIKIPKEACDSLNISKGDYMFMKIQEHGKMSLILPKKNAFESIMDEL